MTCSASPSRSRPVVDEDAGQLVADGPVQQRGHDRRVDAAAESRRARAPRPTWRRMPPTASSTKDAGRPVAAQPHDVEQEVGEQLRALRGVHDLGVELDAVDRHAVAVRGPWRRRARCRWCASGAKPGGRRLDAVAVAHPDRRTRPGRPAKRRAARPASRQLDRGRAVLAVVGRGHLAAQLVGQQLHAVADAQHRHARLEHVGRQAGRVRLVDAGRPAGEDEGARAQRARPAAGGRVAAATARNRRRASRTRRAISWLVLRAEIEHDDRIVAGGVRRDGAGRAGRFGSCHGRSFCWPGYGARGRHGHATSRAL